MGETGAELPLRSIQRRLDELAERRLKGLSQDEQIEYLDLVRLEVSALAERDATSRTRSEATRSEP
jgi:hypothetical protein